MCSVEEKVAVNLLPILSWTGQGWTKCSVQAGALKR